MGNLETTGVTDTHAPRAVERTIEIAAPTDVVWRALTEAEELIRWFPLEARVTPGLGGSVWMRWDAEAPDTSRIAIWEPGRRLRLEDIAGSWSGIATDYHLCPNASGEGTILRVVISGFDDDASWEDTVDAFGRGWDFELRGLRHYLTRHRGTARNVISARVAYTMGDADAWRRVVGARGWLGVVDESALATGVLRARTRTGHVMSGPVQHAVPKQLVVAIEQWNDALFRVQLYGGWVRLWVATYGVDATECASVSREWQESLASMFSPP